MTADRESPLIAICIWMDVGSQHQFHVFKRFGILGFEESPFLLLYNHLEKENENCELSSFFQNPSLPSLSFLLTFYSIFFFTFSATKQSSSLSSVSPHHGFRYRVPDAKSQGARRSYKPLPLSPETTEVSSKCCHSLVPLKRFKATSKDSPHIDALYLTCVISKQASYQLTKYR
ncbi:hypothetical protein RIF29_39260 [Crotalaria pallida]|uniref:Uncharacterized protein n=1 Tax=Crotalaria pallida TaxID=3830 RepID=A0AAN9E0X0_CROPI